MEKCSFFLRASICLHAISDEPGQDPFKSTGLILTLANQMTSGVPARQQTDIVLSTIVPLQLIVWEACWRQTGGKLNSQWQ